MCGQYLIDDETYDEIVLMMNLKEAAEQVPKGTVFPTNTAPVISADGIVCVKWGFPHWKNSGVIINARAETALEKKMFRLPLLKQRCIIPASGFFEWSHTGGHSDSSGKKKKDKFMLRRQNEQIIYMAGMIGTFKGEEGCSYAAFVILTTAANESVAPIHNRMPVILKHDERDRWLTDDEYMSDVLHRTGPELVLLPAG